MPENDDLWERLNYRPAAVPHSSGSDEATQEQDAAAKKRRRRRQFRLLKIVSVLVWLYSLARIFVGDIDTWIAERTAPGYAWILDYRFFIALGVTSLALMMFRRKHFWIPLYVTLFPLIVIFWIIPSAIYKRRSMSLAIGAVHAITALGRTFRANFTLFTVCAFSTLAVTLPAPPWVGWSAIIAVFTVWMITLYRVVCYAFSPGSFVQTQRSLIQRVLDSGVVWRVVQFPSEARENRGEVFTVSESQRIVQAAGFGFISYRVAHYWATKLDRYRKSAASIAFSAIAMVGAAFLGVYLFTLINLAVWSIDTQQFQVTGDPNFLTFVRYSIASMYGSEIAAITPNGSIAAAANILAWASAGLILAMVIVSVVFGYRSTRVDEGASTEIAKLRDSTRHFGGRLSVEYQVSMDELADRLRSLGFDLLGLLAYLSSMDEDWSENEP
ncbi:hypothetical protein [Ruania alba]|uniref:Uncharacterized protein n=1 Tax=Ruania alba TaxID=648782 RepID=A0A1H5GZI6_9MICO|nr:hypothetical protein [Ruania alba]SEE20924.1 hypothetical protein SAMN04488554_1803 [Ruania alba]